MSKNALTISALGLLLGAGCGSDKICGTGTVESGNQCVAEGPEGPDASSQTCGPGTEARNGVCTPVPVDAALAGTPTVASIAPTHTGASGGVLFTITGSGFTGPDVSSLHVYFGDAQNPACEAQLGTTTATSISGQVPPLCGAIGPTVSVVTNNGSALTAFRYDAVVAADGHQQAGDLYVIDPVNGSWADVGALTDASAVTYGITALAFAADGTLYGATDSTNGDRQLVKVDVGTAAVTVVGALDDTEGQNRIIADMKFKGTILYGWDEIGDALVQIDPTTAVVTVIGSDKSSYGSGIAIDSAGTIFHSTSGSQGDLDTVDPTTGGATTIGVMNYTSSVPVNAMAFVETTLIGSFNLEEGGSSTTIQVIDPTTAAVSPWPLLQVGLLTTRIDALDVAPGTASVSRGAPLRWQAPTTSPTASSKTRVAGCTAPVAVEGGDVTSVITRRHQRVALTRVANGALEIATCGGERLRIAAADRTKYALTGNQRGQTKLVDAATGRTVLRGVSAITRR